MTQVSNKSEFEGFLADPELPKVLASNSSAELEKNGLGWRTGHVAYVDTSVSVAPLGVILLSTPQLENETSDEWTYLEVVKLYGNKELPFRVTAVSLFEDIYDQMSTEVLKDFRTLGDAAGYALAAHELHTFDDARIHDHLRAMEKSDGIVRSEPVRKVDVKVFEAKASRRNDKLEDDGFSR